MESIIVFVLTVNQPYNLRTNPDSHSRPRCCWTSKRSWHDWRVEKCTYLIPFSPLSGFWMRPSLTWERKESCKRFAASAWQDWIQHLCLLKSVLLTPVLTAGAQRPRWDSSTSSALRLLWFSMDLPSSALQEWEQATQAPWGGARSSLPGTLQFCSHSLHLILRLWCLV